MPAFDIARGDDWIGIYVNGSLLAEAHEITIEEALDITRQITGDITVTSRRVNTAWLEDHGSLPRWVGDVVWEGDPYQPAAPEAEAADGG